MVVGGSVSLGLADEESDIDFGIILPTRDDYVRLGIVWQTAGFLRHRTLQWRPCRVKNGPQPLFSGERLLISLRQFALYIPLFDEGYGHLLNFRAGKGLPYFMRLRRNTSCRVLYAR